MPEYSFVCKSKKCQNKFDAFCTFDDFEDKFVDVECPKCGKKKPKYIFTINSITFGNNPDKMNNFQYAAEKNFEGAQIESSNAKREAARKGITSPYADLPDFTDNGNRMNFVD